MTHYYVVIGFCLQKRSARCWFAITLNISMAGSWQYIKCFNILHCRVGQADTVTVESAVYLGIPVRVEAEGWHCRRLMGESLRTWGLLWQWLLLL